MKNNKVLPIQNENTEKFLSLALHIVSMEGDAYLDQHPEWNEFVKEAKQALQSENIICNQDQRKDW